jgi:hypothetical protein
MTAAVAATDDGWGDPTTGPCGIDICAADRPFANDDQPRQAVSTAIACPEVSRVRRHYVARERDHLLRDCVPRDAACANARLT